MHARLYARTRIHMRVILYIKFFIYKNIIINFLFLFLFSFSFKPIGTIQ